METFYIFLQIDFLTENTIIYRISKNPEITESELLYDTTFINMEYQPLVNFKEDLEILKVDRYETILPLKCGKPVFSQYLSKSANILRQFNLNYENTTMI